MQSEHRLQEASKLSQIDAVAFPCDQSAGNGTSGLYVRCAGDFDAFLFLYKKHYKLDEEEYDRICKELGKTK